MQLLVQGSDAGAHGDILPPSPVSKRSTAGHSRSAAGSSPMYFLSTSFLASPEMLPRQKSPLVSLPGAKLGCGNPMQGAGVPTDHVSSNSCLCLDPTATSGRAQGCHGLNESMGSRN